MGRDRRLERYTRKDYGGTVDFPVEIRAHDGEVRPYDFTASVRLYQRRLAQAPSRLDDADLVAAEVGHCRARIAQLRRSYFVLHGWTSPEGAPGPEAELPELAGEIAALLRSVFGGRERLDLVFHPLDGSTGRLWFVGERGADVSMLLHVFLLSGPGSADALGAAAELVRRLARAGEAEDAERLVAQRHVGDAVLILSGRGVDVEGYVDRGARTQGEGTADDLEALARRGDLPAVWRRAREVVGAQPWDRDAYVVGAAAARALGRPVDAEELAFVGTGYLPRDGHVRRELAAARLAQGRVDEAIADLEAAIRLEPSLAPSAEGPAGSSTPRVAWVAGLIVLMGGGAALAGPLVAGAVGVAAGLGVAIGAHVRGGAAPRGPGVRDVAGLTDDLPAVLRRLESARRR